MKSRIAINGYGRIGRCVLRALYEHPDHELEIVAINDPGGIAAAAHLTRYDTVHGPFSRRVEVRDDVMIVNGHRIKTFSEPDPARIAWDDVGVDVVLECTGRLTTREKAAAHLWAGARRVVVSAPAHAADATIVYGVNHDVLRPRHAVISNASCTSNCLAVLAQPLLRDIGIVTGVVTALHGYTSDQALTDGLRDDLRRARSAAMSIIPTRTGATDVAALVLPELKGKLVGCGVRVPTINVGILELAFLAARETTVEEVNAIMKTAAESRPLRGVLGYTDEPLVSIDFNHTSASATFDATLTQVSGSLVKVSAWHDNEWGFSNRMLDTTAALMAACRPRVIGPAVRAAGRTTSATVVDEPALRCA